MEEKIAVALNNGGVQRFYAKGATLHEIARDAAEFYQSTIVAAKVNHVMKELSFAVEESCRVDFLDVGSEEGAKIYQRALVLTMIAAARELAPGVELTVEHSLSKGLYCEWHVEGGLTPAGVAALEARMRRLVEADLPIEKEVMPVAQAMELFIKLGQTEKLALLRQLKRDAVSVYRCGDAYDYLHGYMAPSTGCLKAFGLRFYAPGFVLRFPVPEAPDRLPEFVEQPKLARIFAEAEHWAAILHCAYVPVLNRHVEQKRFDDIIRVAEALHEKKIAQIADFVALRRSEVKLILIAGPSSSGKTTFAQRLGVQLMVNGMLPTPISLDNYFVERANTPRDADGNYDFESLEAIDLELFNRQLLKLLQGEEVELPYYNFLTGRREFRGRRIRLLENQPLVIEGIHGLNERLSSAVGRQNKVKIYISALTQLSIDSHNRIPTTDARLIRRIVRDSRFRGHTALRTLRQWPSVRRGEEKNIFPFQEDADIMFNSALLYELSVLKTHAEPLLAVVSPREPEYAEARRLLDFLAYFEPIQNEAQIPSTSILREFIGNSCFQT